MRLASLAYLGQHNGKPSILFGHAPIGYDRVSDAFGCLSDMGSRMMTRFVWAITSSEPHQCALTV